MIYYFRHFTSKETFGQYQPTGNENSFDNPPSELVSVHIRRMNVKVQRIMSSKNFLNKNGINPKAIS